MSNNLRRRSRLLPLSALSILALAACGSLGTPEDQVQAESIWKEMEGHHAWDYFANHVGIQKGNGPHGKFVATYINSVASANQASPPAGSILVKENYTSKDDSTVDSYTVMKRIEGYDPKNGDWFWARFSTSAELTHAGQVAMCADCHFDADGDDLVFLND